DARAPGCRSWSLPRIKQPAVFQDRVAIGHAGHVVGDAARAAGQPALLLGALCALVVFLGHEPGVAHEGGKQLADHAARLDRHTQHALVTIQMLAKKLLELAVLRKHAGTHADERPGLGAHRLDIGGTHGTQLLDAAVDDVDDHVVDHAAHG